MAIVGLRSTADFVTDERPKNWREGILMRYPNGKMTLTALTSLMKSATTDDPEFYWWEKQLSRRQATLNGTHLAAATTLTVTAESGGQGGAFQFKEGDLLMILDTMEIVRVSANPSSDTAIPVTRGFSNTTAADVDSGVSGTNPMVVCIGSAYEEGSSAPQGLARSPQKIYNVTQIFRNTLESTRTAMKTRLRTGDAVKEAKRECLELHGIDMERAFWFGKMDETVVNGKPLRTTNGLVNFIDPANVVTADTATGVDYEWIEEQMFNMFRFGSSEKMAICGNRALLTIQRVIRNTPGVTMELIQGQKEYGMNVSRLISPFGELVLKTHPLFNEMQGGTNTTDYYGVDSWMFCLDMENFRYRPLVDSDTKYQQKLQENGLDGEKSGYLTECGMEVNHATTHYLIKNLAVATAAA